MDKLKERGENMSDMRELIPELDLISVERTSITPVRRKQHKRVTEREYRRMLNESALFLGISLGVNIVQAIMIWILQAGPIG